MPDLRGAVGPETEQPHFDRIASGYHKSADAIAELYVQIGLTLDPLVRGKDVLDVGNGGRFGYDPALAGSVCAMDVSAAMLAGTSGPNVRTVVDDARSMTSVPDASVDVVVFQLMLHHITGPNRTTTLGYLEGVIGAAWRKLRARGHVVIVETLLPPPLHVLQRALYPLTNAFLTKKNVGMIYFFERREMTDVLRRATGLSVQRIAFGRIDIRGWADPLSGSFPGLIKIPGWLSPTRVRIFVLEKD